MTTSRILTNTIPGPQIERHMGVRVVVIFVLGQESIWPEYLGVRPVAGVVVEAPDGHVHQVTGLEGQVSTG